MEHMEQFICKICGTKYKTELEAVKCSVKWSQNAYEDLKKKQEEKYVKEKQEIENQIKIKECELLKLKQDYTNKYGKCNKDNNAINEYKCMDDLLDEFLKLIQ